MEAPLTDRPHVVDVTADTFSDVVLHGSTEHAVLLYFWAEWCEPCKQLGPTLEKIADEYAGNLTLARVDCDREQQIAMQVGIQSLPTVLLIQGGQPVDQFMGSIPEGEIRQLLERHNVEKPAADPVEQAQALLAQDDPAGAIPWLRQAREQQPGNTDVTIDLARALMRTGELDEAEQLADSLPSDVQNDHRVQGIRARRAFAERAAELPGSGELQQRIDADPNDSEARIGLATHCILAEQPAEAMDHLIHVVRHCPDHAATARETLLEIFNLLGPEHPDARRYRQKLFQMLY